jgi:hypothetical protein
MRGDADLTDLYIPVYFDYNSYNLSKLISIIMNYSSYFILLTALLLNWRGITIHRDKILWGLFVVNSIYAAIMVQNVNFQIYNYLESGNDYHPYLMQAYQVYKGVTDYTKLSSNEGPCFYPAGHVWHYLMAVFIHINTNHPFLVMRLVHLAIYQICSHLVVRLAY